MGTLHPSLLDLNKENEDTLQDLIGLQEKILRIAFTKTD